MKGKILALILAVVMCVLALASCELLAPPACEHTFSESWSTSDTEHWHAATCEHGEVKGELAAHTDVDEDGKCDVCEFVVGHDHTLSDNWSFDADKHWKAATCTHTDYKGEEGLHKDDNNDAVCDVCSGHVHIVDASGYCTKCDEKVNSVDESDILALIEAIALRGHTVKSGKVDYDVIIRSVTERQGDEPYSVLTDWNDIEYVFGTNGTYLKSSEDEVIVIGEFPNAYAEFTGNIIITENWIPLVVGAENFTGVTASSVNGAYTNVAPSAFGPDSLNGYYFAVSTFADGHGAENVLYAIVEAAHSDAASDLSVTHDADAKKYVISFNYLAVNKTVVSGEDVYNVNYYEVEVDFTYSEGYAITSMNIKCDCYTNEPGTDNSGRFYQDDVDFIYDPVTGTISLRTDADGNEIPMVPHTYTFGVTQVVGEREEIEIKDTEDFVPESFEVYEDKACTTVLETIEVMVGNNNETIYLAPVGEGFVEFLKNDIKVSVYDIDGNLSTGLQATLTGVEVYLAPMAKGEYNVVISAVGVEKTVRVSVGALEITGEFSFQITNTDNNSWTDYYKFVADKTGTYTFYIPANLGICESNATDADGNPDIDWASTAPEIDPDDPSYNGGVPHSVTVALRKGQSYTFFFKYAVKNTTHTIYYDVE